jgi:hypothetical protein
MLECLSKELFTESLNTIFHVQVAPDQVSDLELIELNEGYSTPKLEQFALLFRAPLASPLGQRMWPMQHSVLGQFDLFLVPVQQDAQSMYYEAVFNRFIQS